MTICHYSLEMTELRLDAKLAVSSNIKRLREEKGLTQKQLADLSGLDQAAISMVENGKRWPTYETIVSICKALNIEHTEVISHPDLLSAFKKLKELK